MTEPVEYVLLVSDNSYVRVFKKVIVQLHGIDLEEAFHLLKSGGHLSNVWTLEDFLSTVRSGRLPDLEPIPAPVHGQKEGMIPFVFGDELVRAKLDDKGAPWFIAKDICRALGISQYQAAVARLDDDERGTTITGTPGGDQEMATVSESGLYALILKSRKPEAKAFRRWVTGEVLPTIRRTGGYRRSSETSSGVLNPPHVHSLEEGADDVA